MIKAILNNELVTLNEITAKQLEVIPENQRTLYEDKWYNNPAGAVIAPDAPDKPSLYHKWDGAAWIVDTGRKQELIALLEAKIDASTDLNILAGFSWNDNSFYLSLENQMNFKALNDIRDELTYPVKVKHQDGYTEIASAVDYHSFYMAGIAFIQAQINAGWTAKDALQNKTTAELIELLNP